jgi:DNA polymerase (family 10)
MKLAFAERCAERLVGWLLPFCDRIEVAGSIRRRRPECGDIDLVVLPRIEVEHDMFGAEAARRNVTWIEIDRRASADHWKVMRAGAEIVSWVHQDVQVDVFFADPRFWGSVLLCKTGSKEHNIWLANYALTQGAKWNPTAGLYIGNRRVSESEEAIYRALGLQPIPPEKREARDLPFASLSRPGSGALLCG